MTGDKGHAPAVGVCIVVGAQVACRALSDDVRKVMRLRWHQGNRPGHSPSAQYCKALRLAFAGRGRPRLHQLRFWPHRDGAGDDRAVCLSHGEVCRVMTMAHGRLASRSSGGIDRADFSAQYITMARFLGLSATLLTPCYGRRNAIGAC